MFCKGNPVVTGTAFTDNFSGLNGGAWYHFPRSTATWNDCGFTGTLAAKNRGRM